MISFIWNNGTYLYTLLPRVTFQNRRSLHCALGQLDNYAPLDRDECSSWIPDIACLGKEIMIY